MQQNLTIVLEPQLYDPGTTPWGVHPDQSRNRLNFTGDGENGVGLPMSDWGLEFADNLPKEILDAIKEARGEIGGTIEDDEYRRRLQDKFGSRWNIKRLVSPPPDAPVTSDATITDETVDTRIDSDKPRRRRKRSKTVHRIRYRATPDGLDRAVELSSPVDIPRFRYATKNEFEEDWHLAMWCPHDHEGPTVVLNEDPPILLEAIQYQRGQYPDVYAEEIGKIVMQVYGEIAVAKIAHSQKLTTNIAEQELDQFYRSEQALTLSLMGLLAEEAVISQRIIKLGRKRTAA